MTHGTRGFGDTVPSSSTSGVGRAGTSHRRYRPCAVTSCLKISLLPPLSSRSLSCVSRCELTLHRLSPYKAIPVYYAHLADEDFHLISHDTCAVCSVPTGSFRPHQPRAEAGTTIAPTSQRRRLRFGEAARSPKVGLQPVNGEPGFKPGQSVEHTGRNGVTVLEPSLRPGSQDRLLGHR